VPAKIQKDKRKRRIQTNQPKNLIKVKTKELKQHPQSFDYTTRRGKRKKK
jgi:hypothetical protein